MSSGRTTKQPIEPPGSESPTPGDHVRTIVELLQPAGPELARRWLAALMLVDRDDRTAVVAEIERQIVSMYGGRPASPTAAERELTLRMPPVQREGYVEEVRRTFSVRNTPDASKPATRPGSRSASKSGRT